MFKILLNTINNSFLYLKYYFYFNLFLFNLLSNIVYYKIFSTTNKKLINFLYYSINKNGCIIIKIIQWLYTNIDILKIDNKNYIIELFNNFYENCDVHSLNYTKKQFKKEFNQNFDDIFELDENYQIRSASIAQIYKAKLKNNEIIEHDNDIVIKVVHPEITFQIIFPILFIRFYLFCVGNIRCLKKYDNVFNIDSFLENIIKQLDMFNELENMKYFYHYYKNNNCIIVPKPIIASNNFLIMDYVEGEALENLDVSDLLKREIVILISLFTKDNYFFLDKFHCDLHDSNWKVKIVDNKPKLIIYDFGYVLDNCEQLQESFRKLVYYLDTNNYEKICEIFYDYVTNKKCDLQIFKEKFLKSVTESYPYSDENVINFYRFCYINNYKLHSCILEFVISFILLRKHFIKYIFVNTSKMYNQLLQINHLQNVNKKYIEICNKYQVFDNIKKHIYETFITSQYLKENYYYKDDNFDYIENNTTSTIQIFDI